MTKFKTLKAIIFTLIIIFSYHCSSSPEIDVPVPKPDKPDTEVPKDEDENEDESKTEQIANSSDIDQIIAWGNDGITKKISFPIGVYEFPEGITLTNDSLILEGYNRSSTILKLTGKSEFLIDAQGNNYEISNMVLDGDENQKKLGSSLFRFNKSKGHQFKNVGFINSSRDAINAIDGYATDGLVVKECTFSNIGSTAIQIFDRNTDLRDGQVVESVEKILIDNSTFKEGYNIAILSDNGNDFKDSGNGTGKRYTENTSLNRTIIQNCTFEKSKQHHVSLSQTKDVIIQNNIFEGMTNDAAPTSQSVNIEQFCHNIEIYQNTFNMPNTLSQAYPYIYMNGAEGYKRVSQAQSSNTYASWTYNVLGGDENRADAECVAMGHTNKDCKRDVHAYGSRNIYIAGNTFNSSVRVDNYLVIREGENIQIGAKKDGSVLLNFFLGGDSNTKKIILGGNDEGSGDVYIHANQNIVRNNVVIEDVAYDLPHISLQKPIEIDDPNATVQIANPSNTDEIITWGNDGVTTKILFPAGVYEFPQTVSLTNEDLILEGSGMDKTIIRLIEERNSLIDAVGNNYKISNLTLDGGKNQKGWGNPIFRFNRSKGHQFENVEFTNSLWMGISAMNAYPTDGLVVKNCVFSNIEHMPINIFNRQTNQRDGEVVVSVDKILIDNCIFKEGYHNAIASDNGNDREDSGDGTGRRYTESTSLNGTIIQNCTFEKSQKFHIGMVQTKDVIIRNNKFEGMTDNAGGGCQPIHIEQFCHNFEIYDNVFNMSNTVSDSYQYINVSATEGHKRVTQERPSDTYPTWTYEVYGSNERRADTQCAKEGHLNLGCKRDVHAYGPRNFYIAGNTFNSSSKIGIHIIMLEAENVHIGTKKDGTVSLNKFLGAASSGSKIVFGGNDEGCGDIHIRAGQNIAESDVLIRDVSFDLPPIHLEKPIVIE